MQELILPILIIFIFLQFAAIGILFHLQKKIQNDYNNVHKLLWKTGGDKDEGTMKPMDFYQNTELKMYIPSTGDFSLGTIKEKLEIRDANGKNT